MYYFLKKIKFHLESQTSHGLHSPFVFDLYNQVLNPILKNKFASQKTIIELEKYLQCPSEYFEHNLNGASKKLFILDEKNIYPVSRELEENPDRFLKSIAIIEKPHKNLESFWQKCELDKNVTFTIDMFEFGLLTFDKIAPKQHFKLRKLR